MKTAVPVVRRDTKGFANPCTEERGSAILARYHEERERKRFNPTRKERGGGFNETKKPQVKEARAQVEK